MINHMNVSLLSNGPLNRLNRRKPKGDGGKGMGKMSRQLESCLERPPPQTNSFEQDSCPCCCDRRTRPAERTLAHPQTGLLGQGRGAIRPILIGMLWSKVLSHLLLQPAKSDLEIFLRDRQFGIGTPQAELAMTTALKAHLADHPTHVVACLDFKNAFGTDRGTCMKVLRELGPHHPAWQDAVNVLLAQPALVINPYRNHLAMTYDGFPQGDPLSTLVFSLTMTEVIHKVVRENTSEVKLFHI